MTPKGLGGAGGPQINAHGRRPGADTPIPAAYCAGKSPDPGRGHDRNQPAPLRGDNHDVVGVYPPESLEPAPMVHAPVGGKD